MKHISVLALVAAIVPFGSMAAPVSTLQSSGVITQNIVAMQHSIMLNSFEKFNSVANLGTYYNNIQQHVGTPEQDPHEKCPPVYGKMPKYGEYGDDGTVFKNGRSGGELAKSNYNWFDWQHAWDRAEFKGSGDIDSRYDLISMGFSNEPQLIDGGYSQFGGFGGLIIANETNDNIGVYEQGGFIGLQQAYHFHGFNIAAAGDLGLLFSKETSTPGDYKFTNFWFGAGLDASYDIYVTETLTLQPGVYGGYMWIYNNGYQSHTGVDLSINNLHNFEVSPALRALARLGNGWYGTLSGRYVYNYSKGGDVKESGVVIPELELKNYAEYGLGIEKNADRFGFGASLKRRDGGRTGWITELNIKYVF